MTATKTRRAVPFAHRYGCPANPERMERYDATRPDGSTTKVTRCNDCGEMAYSDRGTTRAVSDDEMEE